VGEPRPGPAAEFEDDRQKRFLQTVRLAGVGGDPGKPLAEDPALARRLVAEETPRAYHEQNGDPLPRQLRDRAGIAAVNPGGAATTDRASASRAYRRDEDGHAAGRYAQAFEV
jgi:hypothetical protein